MNIFHENWLDNSIQPFQILSKAHSNSIETLQFNPLSANEIATGSHDRLVKIWDIVKFKETQQLKGHQQGVWSLSYSLDGKQIISGSPDKSLIVWDLKSGKAISSLKEHKNKIYWVTCSDNGSYLASGGQDGHIIIWDMRKLKLIKDIESSVDIVQNVHFSQKSQYFFSGDSVGNIKAYDSVSLNQISNNIPKRENPNKIHVLQSITQDNGTVKLFSAQSDKSLSILTFDPKQKQIKKELETVLHFDELHSLSIDKTKTMFSTGCRDGTARVWSTRRNERGYQVIANLLGHNQRVTSAEFHPTSKLIATCSWDQNIHLYKI